MRISYKEGKKSLSGCLKEISAMIPQLVDPGYERLGPIGYVVKAGRRETIRRIQNLKVAMLVLSIFDLQSR